MMNRKLNQIVNNAIYVDPDFYRVFSSRFFGALIGEAMLAEINGKDSVKLEVLVKVAQQIFEEEMQKADTGKVTA